ncbi:hypothetical protein PP336_25420 [Mycobacteroides abscessus]|nr:hypothetical protein [Mycobacteroides abscessus]MDM2003711.1 hypothetical protein [Mycobacteroides abscessus]MDM2013709.1 hypothetical protein [Mycobacteroides abscessus]
MSLRTVQRRSAQLEAAGAWKDAAGQWQIPLAAMRSTGLVPGHPTAPDIAPRDKSMRQHDTGDTATAIVTRYRAIEEQLTRELAEWRRRAEVAEAQAAERERIIETQRMALRMLEAGETPLADDPPTSAPPASLSPRGFLTRLLRF